MSLLDTLLQNSGAITQLGERFGLDGAQVQKVLGQLTPALASGLANHADRNGMPSLLGLLQSFGATSGTGQPASQLPPPLLQQPQAVAAGNTVLGQIFGDKSVSSQVAQSAAQNTGIGADIVKQMLPLAALLVMHALHRDTQAAANAQAPSGGLLGEVTQMPGGAQTPSIAAEVLGLLQQRLSGAA